MLIELENAKARWGGKLDVIDRWLDERRELLVKLNQVSCKEKTLPSAEQLQSFCQILMDYLSAGHFEVYEEVVKQCELNGPQSLAVAEGLYPKISATTDICLNFNDRYSEDYSDSDWTDLDAELSKIAETIATRIELEDELINQLHEKH